MSNIFKMPNGAISISTSPHVPKGMVVLLRDGNISPSCQLGAITNLSFEDNMDDAKSANQCDVPEQRDAATATQPAPEQDTSGNVPLAVIGDITKRAEEGARKYGTTLHTHNGRDALVDAYQEGLDLVQYLKQELMEREEQANLQKQIRELENEISGPLGYQERLKNQASTIVQQWNERDQLKIEIALRDERIAELEKALEYQRSCNLVEININIDDLRYVNVITPELLSQMRCTEPLAKEIAENVVKFLVDGYDVSGKTRPTYNISYRMGQTLLKTIKLLFDRYGEQSLSMLVGPTYVDALRYHASRIEEWVAQRDRERFGWQQG